MLVLAIALAVGLYSALEVRHYLERARPTEQVLVAKRDIPPKAVITRDDVGYVALPPGSKVPGTVQDLSQVVGRRAVASIHKDEQIPPDKLGESNLALGSEERQAGVPVDVVSTVGMTLRPGNVVDVYCLPDEKREMPSREGQQGIPQAYLVAEGAVVVDVLVKTNSTSSPAEERRQQTVSNNSQMVAILKVKASEAQAVATAVGNGRIYLVKRGD